MKTRIFAALLFISTSAVAQQGYNLQFKIDGLRDTTVLLGFYYGESTYAKDTAQINSKGEFSFEGKTALDPGVYFLALNKTRIFELVIGGNQTFKMETSAADYIKNMKVTGDTDNKIFFENMAFNMERHKEAEPYLTIIQDSTLNEDEKKNAREEFNKINQRVLEYQADIIKKYPNTITAKIFKINQPLKVPDPPKKADGTIDSTFQLKWYREHFFDNLSLSDEAMIHMPRPFYREKVAEYLDKLFVPNPDTVNRAIDKIVAEAKKDQETYKYIVWEILLKYQNPDIMGLDAVFVHLYDKYFASGEMDFWANESLKKNLKEHADQLRRSLIGNKGADLVMQDINLKPRSLYETTNKYKYTILYFFDPDCGHCRKETPKLVDFYNKNKTKFNLEVFAVSADTSMQKMRDYIKEMKMMWITVNGPRTYVGPYHDLYDSMTTPTLYILDEKKTIIAKKIPAEKLEEFLSNYEKFHHQSGQL